MSYDNGDNSTYTVDEYSNTYGDNNESRDYGASSFGGGDDKNNDTWNETKADDDKYHRKDSSNDNTPEITPQDEGDNSHSTLFSPVVNALTGDDDSIIPDLDYKEKMNGDSLMKPMLSDELNENREQYNNEDNNCSAADCCYYTVVCCDCTIL